MNCKEQDKDCANVEDKMCQNVNEPLKKSKVREMWKPKMNILHQHQNPVIDPSVSDCVREDFLLPLTSSVGGHGPCNPAEFSAQTLSLSYFNGDSVRFCGYKIRILLEQSDSLETL